MNMIFFITIIEQLNPDIFDIIMDEFLLDNDILINKSKPLKIEISFRNVLDNVADDAYPKFEYTLNNFNDPLLAKAEIAGHLYLHYKTFDIEDDYIDHVIFTISV